jgi:hypothetical protein
MKTERNIAVIDFETDPFARGRIVKPFAWGFYDGEEYKQYWGDDCVSELVLFLQHYEKPLLIYAHNGGKFDYLFMLEYMAGQQPTIINGRIAKWFLHGHELRDSYSILPVPLKQSGEKKEIDYTKMERGVRWRHKQEILNYLKADCLALYRMVDEFRINLGTGLTMAGTATRLLKQLTPCDVDKLSLDQDKDIRSFFFGGRVECFDKGIINGNIKLWDVRSMYPNAMKRHMHPVSNIWHEGNDFDDETDFIEIDATSRGAFPYRTKDGLMFPYGRGIFKITGHELHAAIATKRVDIHRIIRSITFTVRSTFETFVDTYTQRRKQATLQGDEIGKLHYKLVQNSSYGRFALNPEKLDEWYVSRPGEFPPYDDYEIASQGHYATFWRRPVSDAVKQRAISNVATGASITGAARAKLLYALTGAEQKIYCDTDSIIGRNLNVEPDDGQIGSWQLEAEGNRIAVAAKKLYAMFGEQSSNDNERKKRLLYYGDETCIKLASKGVKLKAHDIVRVCCGDTVTWESQSPTMHMDGSQTFMKRKVRMI